MRIAIVGSGRMGGTLGTIFAMSGHSVAFSYARSRSKLERLAERAGPSCRAETPSEAVRDADVVLLAVHWSRLDDVLAVAGSLAGKTVVTCCVPLDEADEELVVAHRRSGAEELASRLPGSTVVAAFQTTPSELLMEVFGRRHERPRPSLVICGDEPASKAVVAGLVNETGYDPVDAGHLRIARLIEPFAMLTAQLAYGMGTGPAWAYRFGRLENVLEG